MWDLNRAERKALGTALVLIGVGLIGRAAFAPGPGDLVWESSRMASRDLPGQEGAVGQALAIEQRAQTPLRAGERIDPNRAPAVELRRLPGIGPGLAAEIARERERRPFAEPADLERVAGIGPATRRRLEPHLAFGRPQRTAAAERSGPGPSGGAEPRDGCGSLETVDVNRAPAANLERLPGIGPALAVRIVDYRTRHGRFATLAALTNVRGIGRRSLVRLERRACAGSP